MAERQIPKFAAAVVTFDDITLPAGELMPVGNGRSLVGPDARLSNGMVIWGYAHLNNAEATRQNYPDGKPVQCQIRRLNAWVSADGTIIRCDNTATDKLFVSIQLTETEARRVVSELGLQ